LLFDKGKFIQFVGKRLRKRSYIPKEARLNRLERYVGIIGNLIWLLALGYSVFLPLQLGTTWFYIGLSIFVIGLILMTITTFNFITTHTDQLITQGAYNFSRHPMYLATFFICLGSGIAAVSWLLIFFRIIIAFCFYKEALIEERYCLNEYGSAYQEYLNNVPRWFGVPNMIGRW